MHIQVNPQLVRGTITRIVRKDPDRIRRATNGTEYRLYDTTINGTRYSLLFTNMTSHVEEILKVGDEVEFYSENGETPRGVPYVQNVGGYKSDMHFIVNGVQPKRKTDVHIFEPHLKNLLSYPGRESLTLQQLIEVLDKQECKCAYTGVQFSLTNLPSLDRKLSGHNGGCYTDANVHFVTKDVNSLKGFLNHEEFIHIMCEVCASINKNESAFKDIVGKIHSIYGKESV